MKFRLFWVIVGTIMPLLTYSQGYFTFIDDDANSVKAIRSICRVAEERGIKICFGAIAGRLLEQQEVIDTLLSFQRRGHQVLNHSFTHDKATWTEGEISREIEMSIQILDSLGFDNTDYLVYPYGRFSQRQFKMILPAVSRHFQVAFNSRGRYNLPNQCNRFYLERFALRKYNDLAMVNRIIQEASEQNAWIVFLTHSGMERDYSSDYVAAVMDECIRHNMKSCTVKEYIEEYGKFLHQSDAISEDSRIDDILELISLNRYRLYLLLGLTLFVLLLVSLLRTKKSRGGL